MLAIQKAQEDLERQDKQMTMREQRSQMMAAMYSRQPAVVDDSEMRERAEAQKLESLRFVDSKEKQALKERAEAFKNKGSNMQQEIAKHEEDAMRRTHYEQEAWKEIIEERKADIRQKTTTVIGKAKQDTVEAPIEAGPTFDSLVSDHASWLMAELQKSTQDQDVTFTFPGEPENPPLRCHSHLLKSRSPYFEGLLTFINPGMEDDVPLAPKTFEIDDFSRRAFSAMLDFFYTGECSFYSSDLLDMLELCRQYLLPDLRQVLEQVIITNLDLDNFAETFDVAKSFDCKVLREALYLYGRKNYQELYRRGQLKNLSRDDFTVIKPV